VKRRSRWIFPLALGLVVAGLGALGGLALSHGEATGCLSETPEQLQPSGRGIESVIASAVNPRKIYVTTRDRRFFMGVAGRRWQWWRVPTRSPGRLFASAGERDLLFAASNALYRSSDRGASWDRLTCGLDVIDVSVSLDDATTIYLATGQDLTARKGGGLYRSVDGGETWDRFTDFPHADADQSSVEAVALDPTAPDTVYIGREGGGIDYSNDGGNDWRFMPITQPGNGTYGPQITSLRFGPDQQTLWVGSRFRGVFSGGPDTGWTFRGLNGKFIDQVLPDVARAAFVYAVANNRAYRSSDSGRHWQRMHGLTGPLVGMTLQRHDGGLYAWGREALFSSHDHGQTWVRLPNIP